MRIATLRDLGLIVRDRRKALGIGQGEGEGGFAVPAKALGRNDSLQLTLAPGAPQLGEKIAVAWRLSGRTQVLRGLKLVVEAREEARYRRGTSTYTDRKPFLNLEVYASASSMEPETGHASLALPVESVPTWTSDNNKIVWVIRVHGEIPRWPDLKEEFVIQVHPPRAKATA